MWWWKIYCGTQVTVSGPLASFQQKRPSNLEKALMSAPHCSRLASVPLQPTPDSATSGYTGDTRAVEGAVVPDSNPS